MKKSEYENSSVHVLIHCSSEAKAVEDESTEAEDDDDEAEVVEAASDGRSEDADAAASAATGAGDGTENEDDDAEDDAELASPLAAAGFANNMRSVSSCARLNSAQMMRCVDVDTL
jgi:hypothetical protein